MVRRCGPSNHRPPRAAALAEWRSISAVVRHVAAEGAREKSQEELLYHDPAAISSFEGHLTHLQKWEAEAWTDGAAALDGGADRRDSPEARPSRAAPTFVSDPRERLKGLAHHKGEAQRRQDAQTTESSLLAVEFDLRPPLKSVATKYAALNSGAGRVRVHVAPIELLLHLPFVKRIFEFALRPLREPPFSDLTGLTAEDPKDEPGLELDIDVKLRQADVVLINHILGPSMPLLKVCRYLSSPLCILPPVPLHDGRGAPATSPTAPPPRRRSASAA